MQFSCWSKLKFETVRPENLQNILTIKHHTFIFLVDCGTDRRKWGGPWIFLFISVRVRVLYFYSGAWAVTLTLTRNCKRRVLQDFEPQYKHLLLLMMSMYLQILISLIYLSFFSFFHKLLHHISYNEYYVICVTCSFINIAFRLLEKDICLKI